MCETAIVTTIMTRATGKLRHIGTTLCALLAGASIAGAAHAADAKGNLYGTTSFGAGTCCAHHVRGMDAVPGANAALRLTIASSAHRIKSVAVTWADLNLDSPAGIEVMRGRLEGASNQVCGPEPLVRDFNGHGYYADCVKDTLRRAVDDLPAAYAYNLSNGTTHELIAEK